MSETPSPQPKHNVKLRRIAIVVVLLLLIAAGIFAILHQSTDPQTAIKDPAPAVVDENELLDEENQPGVDNTSSQVPDTVARTIKFRGQDFDTYHFVSDNSSLQLFHEDSSAKPYLTFERVYNTIDTLNEVVQLITNAGIFNSDFSPTGLMVIDGSQISPLNSQEGNGNFYLAPNGVFYGLKDGTFGVRQTADFDIETSDLQIATQSGPMLVINDSIHPAFNEGSKNLNIRSGVGIDDQQNVVFAISQEEVNFFDFASLFRDVLHCSNALYLDGFISEMYLPDLNRNVLENNRQFSGIFVISTTK